MLMYLPAPLVGVFMMLALIGNTLFWATLLYLAVLVKLLTPKGTRVRDALSNLAAALAQQWAHCNVWIVRTLIRVEWDIRLPDGLTPQGQYLMCVNHQSWNDIFVLMQTFGKKAPFFKFFLKQELIWVPILGLCWWGLDYPFMKRYTPEQVAKNPELRGKDLETTRKACEQYKNQPVMIVNFLEGTRFSAAKRDKQQSPYTHLLKPKSGGFAFALSALGGQLNSLLDVTIVYPGGAQEFWAFMCGKMKKAVVEVRQITIPPEFFTGSYENDPEFRARFQAWIGELWAAKDRRIAEIADRSKLY